MNDPMYAITMAAANLKAVAPEQFNALVDAFRQLETKYASDLLAAEQSLIVGVQGRTWMAAQLRIRLERCMEQRASYQQRG